MPVLAFKKIATEPIMEARTQQRMAPMSSREASRRDSPNSGTVLSRGADHLDSPTTLTSTLTPSCYPHVWEAIAAHVSARTALILRSTCRDMRAIVDHSSLTHLYAKGSFHDSAHGWQQGPFCSGCLLALRQDGTTPVPVPPASSPSAELIRRTCRVLDVDRTLGEEERATLERLFTPHTLRIVPTSQDRLRLIGIGNGTELLPLRHFRAEVIVIGVTAPTATSIAAPPTPGVGPTLNADGTTTYAPPSYHYKWPLEVSDSVRRVVVHHHVHCAGRDGYFREAVEQWPEVVLILHAWCTCPIDYDSHGATVHRLPSGQVIGGMKVMEFAFAFALAVRRSDITIVGLEAFPRGMLQKLWAALKRELDDFTGIIEFRTLEEHRAALSDEQWELEMEVYAERGSHCRQ